MATILQPDATVADALPHIVKKEEYVRIIVANMARCRRVHGNALVRIGIAGDGANPSHRVSYTSKAGREIAYGAYAGSMAFKNAARMHDKSWSAAAMSFEEVQDLLGSLRQFTPKFDDGMDG
jgi:hypothetical protein